MGWSKRLRVRLGQRHLHFVPNRSLRSSRTPPSQARDPHPRGTLCSSVGKALVSLWSWAPSQPSAWLGGEGHLDSPARAALGPELRLKPILLPGLWSRDEGTLRSLRELGAPGPAFSTGHWNGPAGLTPPPWCLSEAALGVLWAPLRTASSPCSTLFPLSQGLQALGPIFPCSLGPGLPQPGWRKE